MATCPSGFNWDGWIAPNACWGNWTIDPKTNGDHCPKIGDPINPATGNMYRIEADYVGAGSSTLRFQRTYNAGLQIQNGALGANWSGTYDRSIGLYLSNGSNYVLLYRPDGKILYFDGSSGTFTATADITGKLSTLTGSDGKTSGYQYVSPQGDEVETYDANGKLLKIVARSGLTQTLAYDSQGRLATVTDNFGHRLGFAYDAKNRIVTLTDPSGSLYQYGYDAQGQLVTVTYPGGATRTYLYNEP
ncbi:DUF6531 domain-containing protein, partial [Paraherbaspirillum soli]